MDPVIDPGHIHRDSGVQVGEITAVHGAGGETGLIQIFDDPAHFARHFIAHIPSGEGRFLVEDGPEDYGGMVAVPLDQPYKLIQIDFRRAVMAGLIHDHDPQFIAQIQQGF